MISNLKLGAVPYLNAEPLTWPIENGELDEKLEILRATPSELVGMLTSGELDCALAPIASLLDFPDLVPVPDVSISCRGPVASVLLFHKGPLDLVKKIQLDPSSKTSNLLIQIIMGKSTTNPCEFILPEPGMPIDPASLDPNTGMLLIGDPAIKLAASDLPGISISDLGALWKEMTNHPFTFARWIARNGDIAASLSGLLKSARDWSVLNLHELIGPLSEKYNYPIHFTDHYLRTNITYMHGPREIAGEREFLSLGRKIIDGAA